MPIIDASTPFSAVKASTTVSAASVGRYGLKVAVSNATHHQLFSMAGGVVFFAPQGKDPFLLYQTYDDLPPLAPGSGYVLQRVWAADIKQLKSVLPEGIPPMIEIVYFNVAPQSVRLDLEPRVRTVALSLLKTLGVLPGNPGRQQYENQMLDKILQGESGLFVPGGAKVGKMLSGEVTIFLTGGDIYGLSPILYVRNMPSYGGQEWEDHPLIEAVSTLAVPIDVNAVFQAWDSVGHSFKPLPDGLSVDLVDYNFLLPPVPLVTTQVSDGKGGVRFELTDQQLAAAASETAPDLFFRVHLGASNPEPLFIQDPWSSEDSFSQAGSLGYFADFTGTRLGSYPSPLLFQIGLGFWADVISFRPPPAVQLELKGVGRRVQPIEKAVGGELPLISLDYYAVKVDALPDTHPTPDGLLEHIRIGLPEFVDKTISLFKPTDMTRWKSTNPVGTVVNIDFYFLGVNLESGSIVLGASVPEHWTVNTIYDPVEDLGHPLGGIRRWGYSVDPKGGFIFYTMGADRPWSFDDYEARALIFGGADRLWKSFQKKVETFVNKNGGQAAALEPPFAERFFWPRVAVLHWRPDPNNPWTE